MLIPSHNDAMDALIDEPEAYALWHLILRLHLPFFAFDGDVLPTRAITPLWPKGQLERAVAVLVKRGFISEINSPFDGAPSGIYRHRGLFSEADLRVTQRDGKWLVTHKDDGMVLAACASNSAAWRWIDQNSGAGQADEDRHYRIRNSAPFS